MANTSASGGPLTPTGIPVVEYDDALDAIFQGYLAGISGLPGNMIRPRWQATEPKQPERATDWAAMGVMLVSNDFNPFMFHDGAANGGLGQDQQWTHERFELKISFYGPNSMKYATQTRDGVQVAQNNEAFAGHDIEFVDKGDIKSVPEIVNQLWFKRQDISLFFHRKVIRTYDVQNLVSAPVVTYWER